ncbi:hypothetical protein PoB_006363000 [Plakobranchus ocellatus]|uniref:Uncharacterized protein n=1 Tax=Plakobranchus ocellatus TaxID=259542 RepID=A0AAV4CZC3_9GAST|nr:hypothetical protein PoB_006363000 [Plakobranchus ocellatus]
MFVGNCIIPLRYKYGVGGTVDSESALRSAGTLLLQVRVWNWPPGETEGLKAEITLLWTGYVYTTNQPLRNKAQSLKTRLNEMEHLNIFNHWNNLILLSVSFALVF